VALNSYIEKQVVGHGVGERFQYGWSGGWGGHEGAMEG
jgi:hypothetical protein